MTDIQRNITTALAWCLAWGDQRESRLPRSTLQEMQQAIGKDEVPADTRGIVEQVKQLDRLDRWLNSGSLPSLAEIQKNYPELWQQKTAIGLVYGGATKIKGYVFEAANLQDIRGASALLERINSVDLPAFFGKEKDKPVSRWLEKHFPGLKEALIPELIVYSTGGNILAFCPAAFVDDLANAIEKRYTEETLTANSCAVGERFRLLEIRLGLLKDSIEDTLWIDWYRQNYQTPLVQAYFGSQKTEEEIVETFKNRKSFNELAGKLAARFQQRRNGNRIGDESRPSRRYPPIFETHPYVVRDENEQRSAIAQTTLPGTPHFSDSLARKRLVGQRVKRESASGQKWYYNDAFRWQFDDLKRRWSSGKLESWVLKFRKFLQDNSAASDYYGSRTPKTVGEARRMEEIANASDGFVAFIYADGNNMGGYIQKIKSPEEYAKFSEDVFKATEKSVYRALKKHLRPHQLKNLKEIDAQHRNGKWIHPFEIITIGGDDVMLIVPANKALQIAQTLGEEFENILLENNKDTYGIESADILEKSKQCHRYYNPNNRPDSSRCQLSMSTGVLITSYSTPIYYAEKLTNQLLKSAKKKAKDLKGDEKALYHSGTIDVLTLKSVTMISSNLQEFREIGLTKKQANHTLKFYAAPYTLYEMEGLIQTIAALKKSEFPRSQLYQIRSLLEQGKRTAILNYLYFRSRLKDNQALLTDNFEAGWCKAKTNNGSIAPWMYAPEEKTYETIWREMVDLYPFIDPESVPNLPSRLETTRT